jgi:hypothetical protein
MSQASSARRWISGGGVCLLGIVLAMRCSRPSQPPSRSAEHQPRGAYRPDLHRSVSVSAPTRTEPATRSGASDGDLSPELEQRLRAAMTVMTVPPPPPPGQPAMPPPSAPVSPEREAQRQLALIDWKAEAQRLLDGCVARPEALRQPVALNVVFAPISDGTGYVPQRLSPVAISVPGHELRRLWHDTDPDALQGCIDGIRSLTLAVSPAPNAPAQALPASTESVLVRL